MRSHYQTYVRDATWSKDFFWSRSGPPVDGLLVDGERDVGGCTRRSRPGKWRRVTRRDGDCRMLSGRARTVLLELALQWHVKVARSGPSSQTRRATEPSPNFSTTSSLDAQLGGFTFSECDRVHACVVTLTRAQARRRLIVVARWLAAEYSSRDDIADIEEAIENLRRPMTFDRHFAIGLVAGRGLRLAGRHNFAFPAPAEFQPIVGVGSTGDVADRLAREIEMIIADLRAGPLRSRFYKSRTARSRHRPMRCATELLVEEAHPTQFSIADRLP